jgi:hypothetical protein
VKISKFTAILGLCLLCLNTNGQTKSENPSAVLKETLTETVKLRIGETEIQAMIHKGNIGKPLFFNMHDDENTSVEAAKLFVVKHGGKIIELKHDGERRIKFKLKNKNFSIDPNRIFTMVGIVATLKENKGKTSPEVEKSVDVFAKTLISKFLADSKIIIALHNNTDEDYSLKSYEKGGKYEKDAAQVFAKSENDIDDFFFVTEQKYFDVFKAKGFNVVLQNNQTVVDDGSLSVYCGREKITYINVEAQHGHQAEQLKMLEALREVLDKNK